MPHKSVGSKGIYQKNDLPTSASTIPFSTKDSFNGEIGDFDVVGTVEKPSAYALRKRYLTVRFLLVSRRLSLDACSSSTALNGVQHGSARASGQRKDREKLSA